MVFSPLCPRGARRLRHPVAFLITPSLLLNTHAPLWWLVEPEKLSTLAQEAINDPAATIFVSAASGWELATNGRLGKLPGAERLLQHLPSLLQHQGFQLLAVQSHHGVHAGGYTHAHRDPDHTGNDGLIALAQFEINACSSTRRVPSLQYGTCSWAPLARMSASQRVSTPLRVIACLSSWPAPAGASCMNCSLAGHASAGLVLHGAACHLAASWPRRHLRGIAGNSVGALKRRGCPLNRL
jgi:PIN domain nuclease of toxin-antitoxin system